VTYGAGSDSRRRLVANYVGNRTWTCRTLISAESYFTGMARWATPCVWYTISINGYNLSDRRDPVLQSELGEGSSICSRDGGCS